MAKKPKTPKPNESGKKKPAKPLSREPEPKPLSNPRQMQRAQILLQLHDLIAACEELFESDGEGARAESAVVVVSHVSPIKAAVAWALGSDDAVAWRLGPKPVAPKPGEKRSSSAGDSASSMIFWCRRWTEHSRSSKL